MTRCTNLDCLADATEEIEVKSAWLIDRGTEKARPRVYRLCPTHHAKYFPRGDGYLRATESLRLRAQCAEYK